MRLVIHENIQTRLCAEDILRESAQPDISRFLLFLRQIGPLLPLTMFTLLRFILLLTLECAMPFFRQLVQRNTHPDLHPQVCRLPVVNTIFKAYLS